jgi:hypothetical protein
MMYFYLMSSNINVRETWSDNQEWIIGRHSQHWAHKKEDKDKTKHTTQDRKLKNMSNTDPTKNPGAREG